MSQRHILSLALALGAALTAGSVHAQDDYYAGKRINLIIPAGAGGAYGIYALLLADHMPRHIPGNPTIVPEYMNGAGGMRATNYAANVAPKDGTTMYMIHQNAATQQLLAPEQAQYNATDFPAIGILSSMNSVMVVSDATGISDVTDAMEKTVVTGSTGRGSYQFIIPTLLNEFLGTQFNLVTTYTGTAETMLALERGEIDAFMTSLLSLQESRPAWVDGQDGAHVVLQVGATPDPAIADVPLLTEFAETDEQRAIFQFLSISNSMARSLVMAPGTPEDQVEILRQAFEDLMVDDQFLAAAGQLGVPLVWADAAALSEVLEDTLATPMEIVDIIKQYIVEE